MNNNMVKGIGAVVLVLALGVGFWLVRPLFTDSVVDEDFPMSAGAVIPDDMTQEEVEAEMEAAAAAPAVEQAEDMPGGADAAPVALSNGMFEGADSFHQGEGDATVFELADGSRILRFENFQVTNGPDLRVYLAPLVDGVPRINDDAVELGRLKGNIGNQNYDIPADLDLSGDFGVLIWCEPFRVGFASAVLA